MNSKIKNLFKNLIKKESIIWVMLCAIMVIAIIVMLITSGVSRKRAKQEQDLATQVEAVVPEPEIKVVTEVVEKEKIVEVEVEKEVTQEMLQEGLDDMGLLITEEYYFTQVEEFKKTQTIMKYITTESSFMYSYDGVVSAGVDFGQIKVTKDDANKRITVEVPTADIQMIDIDYDSFQVYSEKEGLWNPISVEDYNESMVEFEAKAKQKALDKGILGRANDSAEGIIRNFVNSLIDTNEYHVEYVKTGNITK